MSLHPDFPVIEADYRLTREWALSLPDKFNRRIEDGNMVIWRPRVTFWVAVWGNDKDKTPDERLAWILAGASPQRDAEEIHRSGSTIRLTYRMIEHDAERQPSEYIAVSGYVIAAAGHVQISAYCDDDDALAIGYSVIQSVRFLPNLVSV